MKTLCACLGLCSMLLLQGCFESSHDSPNKDGDKSKASLQMQQGKTEENK